ncbi:MAG: YafY family transcriptional regulator [Clostridiales bacterium]|jgi:predicted DNA-binding transcriptional regulator YafY|nr:YafY family transcriptional regulator [Clostridiales bacterium]
MRTNRLFQIIYILLKKGTVTAEELARYFEVSQRTIYRDIDILSVAGVPVYTKKGKGGGISLLQDFVLDKSLLSDAEQNDILSALYGFASVGSGDSAPVLHKLSTFFSKKAVPWLDVDFSDWGDSNLDLFDALKTAILKRRIVAFDYYNSCGEKSRRKVEPVQIRFKDRAWYMYGYCLCKEDYRIFKLTRIQNFTVTDTTFACQHQELGESTADNEKTEMISGCCIEMRFAPQAAYRLYDTFDISQIHPQEDGGFLVSITWPLDDWVWGFILSFGGMVEVLQPAALRTLIQEKAAEIVDKYK